MKSMQTPSFEYEQQYWQEGILHIAGLDEVGMGALAGPVVSAAVIWKSEEELDLQDIVIRDSKKMSAKQREKASIWIKEHALAFAIGEATLEEIAKLNIRNAAHLAMRRAIEGLSVQPDMLLIDGTPAQVHPSIPAENIIKGDSLSLSIGAASIIAKVHRDNLMRQIHQEFPQYGFDSHKGYASPIHLAALEMHGPCAHHRRTYAPIARFFV